MKSFSQVQPHIVFKHANGGYVCDTKCIGFNSNKLCAHLLAAAVKQCSLDSFFSWFLQKYDLQANRNLTRLTVNNQQKMLERKGLPGNANESLDLPSMIQVQIAAPMRCETCRWVSVTNGWGIKDQNKQGSSSQCKAY